MTKSAINKNILPKEPVILAFETSGQCGSIALVTPDCCLAEFSLNTTLTHSRRLLAALDELLDQTNLELSNLAGLAVSIGPGSFTGLRIGLSTVKGLAMGTGLPLIGIPTLDGLAHQLPFVTMPICPIIDARKKEVFTALYHWKKDGVLARDTDYLAIPPDQLADRINEPTVFIGDGIKTYKELLRDSLGTKALFASSEVCYARAGSIGRLALDKWRNNDFLNPAKAAPIYIRPSEAEINLEKRTKGKK